MKITHAWLALLIALGACSASDRDLHEEDAGGDADGAAGAGQDAGECGPLMFRSGPICIDEQPALLGDGSQGPEVSWTDANTVCTARGLRLCTESERETACPGGPEPTPDAANNTFCSGPSGTWEWSSAPCSNPGHCRSPCCNAGPASGYGCHYDACDTSTLAAGFHCCKTLP
jgi:hypothetical protein